MQDEPGRGLASGQPDGEAVSEPEEGVVPSVGGLEHGEAGQVGVLVVQERRHESGARVDLGGGRAHAP
ncbi:hypothetical protein GCM10026982_02180 [Nocardiopsis aegyptia]